MIVLPTAVIGPRPGGGGVADVDWLGPREYLVGRRTAKLVRDPAFQELVHLRILSERCASIQADCCSQIAGVWGDCIHDTARRIVYLKFGWEPV